MKEGYRIINTLMKLESFHNNTYLSLSDKLKKQINLIKFEEIATKTEDALNNICTFLGVERSNKTRKECIRQRCPRVLSKDERLKKYQIIKETSSEDAMKKLDQMVDDYEKEF